jgi:hypothetical protein
MSILVRAVDHLVHNVIPAAADYAAAEDQLSRAYAADRSEDAWQAEARAAIRQAANLAIAIDGLPERCTAEIGRSKTQVRTDIAALCLWPGSQYLREGCIERIQGVANAYKHDTLRASHPIASLNDVLAVTLGYGLDAYGVGKFSGIEVVVKDKSGQQWKFLGDAPVAIGAWVKFLSAHRATLPPGHVDVCGLRLTP